MADVDKRHSKIRKTISRKIQTDDFESLDVYVSVEEWVEWDTDEERAAETKRITGKLLDDFTDSFNRTVSALGVNRLIGTGTTRDGRKGKVTEKLSEEKKPADKKDVSDGNDDDWDILD